MSAYPHTTRTTEQLTRSGLAERTSITWLDQLLWIVGAAVLGFAVSAVFTSILEVPRSWYVAIYAALVLIFFGAYIQSTHTDLVQAFRHRWLIGLCGAIVLGMFMTWSMLRDPASPRPEGLDLFFNLLWLGVVYGIVDALLLFVLPYMAVRRIFDRTGRMVGWLNRSARWLLTTLASLLVTAAYHLGYVEFRDGDVGSPLFGGSLTILGYLITANPLTAVLTHIVLHVVSVWHGIDSTVTLPPHY